MNVSTADQNINKIDAKAQESRLNVVVHIDDDTQWQEPVSKICSYRGWPSGQILFFKSSKDALGAVNSGRISVSTISYLIVDSEGAEFAEMLMKDGLDSSKVLGFSRGHKLQKIGVDFTLPKSDILSLSLFVPSPIPN
jgi:hypothetical protein